MIACDFSGVVSSGFSHSTCLPARAAGMATVPCKPVGVAMVTASIGPADKTCRDRRKPRYRVSPRTRAPASDPCRTQRSAQRSTSLIASAWNAEIIPAPMIPNLTFRAFMSVRPGRVPAHHGRPPRALRTVERTWCRRRCAQTLRLAGTRSRVLDQMPTVCGCPAILPGDASTRPCPGFSARMRRKAGKQHACPGSSSAVPGPNRAANARDPGPPGPSIAPRPGPLH